MRSRATFGTLVLTVLLQVLPFGMLPAAAASPAFVPGELIIAFQQGVTDRQIADFYRAHGANEDDDLDGDADDRDPEEKLVDVGRAVSDALIARLERDPRVQYAERNYILTAGETPNDPRFTDLWGLNNTGQTGGTADADVDAPEAWATTTGAGNAIVGVIDSGVSYNHEDLQATMWRNPGEIAANGRDDDGNGYVDDVHGINAIANSGNPMDDNGHGTHVAGTIAAAANNAKGVTGLSSSARIAGCKFLSSSGSGSTSNAIKCFKYFNHLKHVLGQNIVVTNNSWVGGGYSQALRDAMAGLDQPAMSPILHVCAAGNSNVNNDSSAHYPSSYALDHVVSVAATDHNDRYASFSNWGPKSVDLAAPGAGIWSTHWTSSAPTTAYRSMSGTSMASPHVAGAAAEVYSTSPALGALQLKERLLESVDPIGAVGSNSSKPTVTNGRLNVASAVYVDEVPPTPPVGMSVTAPPAGAALDLAWTANAETDVAGYNVYRTTDPATAIARTWQKANPSLVTSPAYLDTGLTNGTTYHYQVTAVDRSSNESDRSAETSGTPSDTAAPAAPTGLAATAGDAQVSLDWADNVEPDVATYQVLRTTDAPTSATRTWSDVATTNVSSYTDTRLSNGTTYHYRVSATDTTGNVGQPSAEASALPARTPKVLQVTDGWDERNNKTLVQDGKLRVVQVSDNSRVEIERDRFYSFQFETTVPAEASIEAVKIGLEHYEESSFTGAVPLQVHTGALTARTFTPLAQANAPTRIGSSREGVDRFDVTSVMTDPSKVNALKFVVRNQTTNGRKVRIDRVFLEVSYSLEDRTPPETTITSAPTDPTNSTSAGFTFESSEQSSTFECSFDGSAFTTCTSPSDHGGLSDGAHTFTVRATDAKGNVDATPATHNWSVDSVAPSLTSTTPAADGTGVATTTAVTAAFSEAMDAGTITPSTFTVTSAAGSVAGSVAYNATTNSATFTPAAPLSGTTTYSAEVAALVKDAAGNALGTAHTWSFTTAAETDVTPPETTIESGPTGSVRETSASFTFGSSEAGSTFECSLDGAPFAPCTSAVAHDGLSEGGHVFEVKATDASGNTDPTPATRSWTVDTSTETTLYLHNEATSPDGDTSALANMPMNTTAPTATRLYRYSTNYYNDFAGRFIDKRDATHNESRARYMANWTYQLPATTTLAGDIQVELWVAVKDLKCDKTPAIHVYLREKSSATTTSGTLLGSRTATLPRGGSSEPCAFQQVRVTVPVDATIAAGRWLELKVTVDEDASGADAALLAYDTTTHAAKLVLP